MAHFSIQEVPQLLWTTLYRALNRHFEHGGDALQGLRVQVGEHAHDVRPKHLRNEKEDDITTLLLELSQYERNVCSMDK